MKRTLIQFFSIAAFLIVFTINGQVANPTSENEANKNVNSISSNVTDSDKETIEFLQSQIERKKKLVESIFYIEEVAPASNGYFGNQEAKVSTKLVKKRIFNAGQILIESENSKLAKNIDMQERIQINEDLIKIYDRMITLGNKSNTRATEKALKKLETPDQINPIFFGQE